MAFDFLEFVSNTSTEQLLSLQAVSMADLQESLKKSIGDKPSRRDAGAPSQSVGGTSDLMGCHGSRKAPAVPILPLEDRYSLRVFNPLLENDFRTDVTQTL